MKIAIQDVLNLLQDGRIFIGRGTKRIEETGTGFPAGSAMNVQPGIEIEPYTTYWAKSGLSLVSMGAFSYTHSLLPHEISVGRYSSIAKGLRVMGDSHPSDWVSSSPVFYNHKALMKTYSADRDASLVPTRYRYDRGNIRIGNDVWIGEHVTLGHGVTIGDGAIIASNATVTKDVPPYTVVGGLPAKPIRPRFDEVTTQALQESRWWLYEPRDFSDLDATTPLTFAQSIISRAGAGDIEPFMPGALIYNDFKALAR